MPANRHIITLTTNNSISELMLKTNELIYEWNSYAVTNPMDSTATFESSIIVNGDIFVGIGNTSINQHVANNYSHGVVIKDILFNANTGVLDLTYNDLSTANINLDIGIQDDAFFKTVTADTFYAGTLEVTGNTAMTGVLLVNSGIVNSTANTVNLFATPTSLTLGSAGTIIDIGSTSGITSIRNNTSVLGTLDVTGVSTFTSNVSINSGILTTSLGTFNILPDTGNINIGASNTGITIVRNNTQIDGTLRVIKDVTLDSNLIVKGATTTIDTDSLFIKDKNIEIGVVGVPTNSTADGGGITLKGAVGEDKTITWDLPNNNWTSSENWNLSSTKVYKINNVEVLSSTALGSGVIGSVLTSVGTITTGVWNGSTIDIARGGTNITSYTKGDVLYASADNVLSKLPIGSVDQLFQVTSDGVVHWITNLSGGDY